MSKYKTQAEWEAGLRVPLIILAIVTVLLIIGAVILSNGRTHQAEMISQDLSIEEIRRQMEDPDSYRF